MSIIEHIINYKFLYIGLLALIVLIIILIALKPKKVKPIEITIDDTEEETKSEIEKVIEALEGNKSTRSMTTFEEEQEANAIISYQELVKAVNEKRALYEPKPEVSPEVKKLVDEISKETEEIVIAPSIELEEVIEPKEVPEKEEVKQPKFKNSEFISPVFGKDSNKTNDDFLKELKDFRSNL